MLILLLILWNYYVFLEELNFTLFLRISRFQKVNDKVNRLPFLGVIYCKEELFKYKLNFVLIDRVRGIVVRQLINFMVK